MIGPWVLPDRSPHMNQKKIRVTPKDLCPANVISYVMRMNVTDEDLALAAAGGDADAFEALLTRTYDRLFALCFRLTGNRAEAEDLTQDICAALPAKLMSYHGEAKVTTWLYRVTLSSAIATKRCASCVLPRRWRPSSAIGGHRGRIAFAITDGAPSSPFWQKRTEFATPDKQRRSVAGCCPEDFAHDNGMISAIMNCLATTFEPRKAVFDQGNTIFIPAPVQTIEGMTRPGKTLADLLLLIRQNMNREIFRRLERLEAPRSTRR